MDQKLFYLSSVGYKEAKEYRKNVARISLELHNEAAKKLGKVQYGTVEEYKTGVARRTACITLLAGTGSRWRASLKDKILQKELPENEINASALLLNPERPRGLCPVRDLLGLSKTGLLPLAAYSIIAVHGLGRHIIITRGWSNEIDRELLSVLGIHEEERQFFEQQSYQGRVLGHGDAVYQCRHLWQGCEYIITNFAGDSNSTHTVLSALLAIDALSIAGANVHLLLPAAFMQQCPYPIAIDEEGLPRSFIHPKLQGASVGESAQGGWTNVGIRVYRSKPLLREMEAIVTKHFSQEGYSIPGNDPKNNEFSLDNVDTVFAEKGRARILAVANKEEICPVKTMHDIPAFEEAMAQVLLQDKKE